MLKHTNHKIIFVSKNEDTAHFFVELTDKIGDKAIKSNLHTKAKLGRAAIYVIDYLVYYRFVIELIKGDPWITVNGPKFNISL